MNRTWPTGLSPFEPDIATLARALTVAEVALTLSERNAAGFEDLLSGSWRLLLRTAADDPDDPDDELHALVDATVARARAPGRGSPADLIDTLRAYLTHCANLNTTARAVYAHRHTVAHRLTRVRELTGHDAQTPDGQAQLTLGLQALAVHRAATELSHPGARVAHARDWPAGGPAPTQPI